MSQRIDVFLDGQLRLSNQSSANPLVWTRVNSWAQSHVEVKIRRHTVAPPPPPPPPPPPQNPWIALAQNVMFTAWRPTAALDEHCGPKWKVAVSADPSYEAAVRAAVPQLKAAGHKVPVWGNQSQIGAERIKSFGAAVGADYLIFQAETSGEYADAVAAGATVIVGNPNSLTAEQRTDAAARVNAGHAAWIFETYTNCGDPWPDQSSSAGVPVASFCPGVGWCQNPYSLADYKPRTPAGAWPLISVYLAEDVPDWAYLP